MDSRSTAESRGSTRASRGSRRGALAKLGALGLGVAASLVLLEGLLWLLAALHAPEARGTELGKARDERRILCFGDSNTYGVHLAAEESYPGQLQRHLDRAPAQPWRVVNLGYPGTNSAQVRRRLAADLKSQAADVAVVWVGINNSWSLAESQLWELPDREEAAPLAARFVSRLRSVKLARILLQRLRGASSLVLPVDGRREDGDVPLVRPGDQVQRPLPEVQASIRTDLRRIRTLCDELGVRLLFANYPFDTPLVRDTVNPTIAAVAAETGTPLVDLRAALVPLYAELGFTNLMLPDCHANANGNHEVARQILLALLAAGYLDEGAESTPEWTSVPPIESLMQRAVLRRAGLSDNAIDLEVEGPPGWRPEFRLMVVRRTPDGLLPDTDPARFGLGATEWPSFGPPLDAQGRLSHRLALPTPWVAPGSNAHRLTAWRIWVLLRAPDGSDRALAQPLVVSWTELEGFR